jgi:inner membrane protein
MDTLTHIVIGACIGEAILDIKIGRKALLVGAIAQSLPDIDFIAATWMDTTHTLLAHRGITHSILFVCLIAAVVPFLLQKFKSFREISYQRWALFWLIQLFVHIFLDAFNNYGVGWFEPFNHYRISFNAIYVADPFLSIWPGIAFFVLIILRLKSKKRRWWGKFGVGMTILYLVYATFNKLTTDAAINRSLNLQKISFNRYFTTPTPLNNWLWYVVAANDSGYYVGYHSVFEGQKPVRFEYFPRNESLLSAFPEKGDIERLIRFSQGYYTVEQWKDTLVFNDLRFGQEIGWQEPRGRFAFHYYLNFPKDNKLVVQRGRFAKWDKQSVQTLMRRAFNIQ